jgi:hypothetical protein
MSLDRSDVPSSANALLAIEADADAVVAAGGDTAPMARHLMDDRRPHERPEYI